MSMKGGILVEQREFVVKSDKNFEQTKDQDSIFFEGNSLNFISITYCGLTVLKDSIAFCHQLVRLSLANNELTTLPDGLGSIELLNFLDISGNEITALPASMSKLAKLDTFIAAKNMLTSDSLFDLSKLEELLMLDLSHNLLDRCPLLQNKPKLHTINLGNNKIQEVDDSFGELDALKDLNLQANSLTEIPVVLKNRDKIRQLNLSNNAFKDSRFKKLVNDQRAKSSAILAYIAKAAPSKPKSKQNIEVESVEESPLDTTLIRTGVPGMSVQRLSSAKEIRPYLVCCVLRNLDLSGENFKKFINIQTKLHTSMCNNRVTAAIGTHDMKTFQPPLQYLALPPDEIHITALRKKVPVSGRELVDALVRDAEFSRKRTKRSTLNPLHRYLHLVQEMKQLPCLTDSTGLVISMAPLTNSDITKMSEQTTSVWIEVSSSESLTICRGVLDALILETKTFNPKIDIDQVRVESSEDGDLISAYPDKNDLAGTPTKREDDA